MKRFILLGILLASGCASAIVNPVQSTRVYELENAYGIAQSAALAYVALPRCQVVAIQPCSKAANVVALGEADKKARIALSALEDFSRSPANYPTLSFTDLLRAAQSSMTVFSQLSSIKGA